MISSCLSNFEPIVRIIENNDNLMYHAEDGCKENDNAQITTYGQKILQ